MAGDDRVRHCSQCNRNVYNFAAMTLAEVDELISTREDRLCARLYQREDGTILTSDRANPFQVKVRRISRVVGIALSAATINMNLAAAQSAAPQSPSALVQIQPKATGGIAVRIVDPTGAVIMNAKISVTDETGKQVATGSTNESGQWQISSLSEGKYTIFVSAPGFQRQDEHVTVLPNRVTELELTAVVAWVGEVTSVSIHIEPESPDLQFEPIQISNKLTGLTVQIHDQDKAPVPKARVSFKDHAGKKHAGLTDKDGNYSFSPLDPGEYELTIHISGAPVWKQKVEIVRDKMVLVQLIKPVVVTVGELIY